jgi:hypothetical protein
VVVIPGTPGASGADLNERKREKNEKAWAHSEETDRPLWRKDQIRQHEGKTRREKNRMNLTNQQPPL